ncbi:sulfite exporter TauE/SafE family protein [Lachnospiraceae bacterium 54-53]
MLYFVFLFVSFVASVVGSVCGIGGGVIIKPVLDSIGVMDVGTISFLSGCTVFSMSAYSVVSGKISGDSRVELRRGFPLAAGAAAGGLMGKWMFSYVSSLSADQNRVGAVQAVCLLAVTAGTLVYTVYKKKIKTYQIQNAFVCMLIGLSLGVVSSFLGIGGGPMNLVVLFFFFSMSTREAAEHSLYVIFFSQAASLASYAATGSIPDFSAELLILMAGGAFGGGILGKVLNQRLEEKVVDLLFTGLLVVMILLNIYNIIKFI